MKFIDTKRFSPVVHGNDLPFKDDYYHIKPELITKEFLKAGNYDIDDAWWKKQHERCKYGFTVKNAIIKGGDSIIDGRDVIWDGRDAYMPEYNLHFSNGDVTISGRMYFYLNFWWIYGLDRELNVKTLIKPRFIDMDYLYFERVRLMVEMAKDTLEPKARQKGFSEKAAGGIIGWNYTFVPNSVNIIVAGTDDDAEHTMYNTKRGLELLKNTQFYKQRTGKHNGVDKVAMWKAKYYGSEIHKITAKDNPQALNRFTPYWVLWEEVGKWKRDSVLATRGFALPAQKAEGRKTGYNTFQGTGGDMEGGAADLEKMAYYPEEYNCLTFKNNFEKEFMENSYSSWFTGDTWGNIMDDDGNSLKAESIKARESELRKMPDKDKYQYKTQHPINLEDCFYASTGGYFGEIIINKLHNRKQYIRTHRTENKGVFGRFEWSDTKDPFSGVDFIKDENGYVMIYEEPKKDSVGDPIFNLYNIATDSYDQDEAEYSNSKGACFVYKRFYSHTDTYNKFVARIIERPTSEEGGAAAFYEHTAMLCIYYNKSLNLIEYSKIRIIDWYERNGFENLLKPRPDFVIANMIHKTSTKNKYGIDPSTKSHWLAYLKDSMTTEFINRLDDVETINAFIKFQYISSGDPRKYNCDITIATSLCIVADKDDEGITAKSQKEMQKTQDEPAMHFVEGPNGVIQRII